MSRLPRGESRYRAGFLVPLTTQPASTDGSPSSASARSGGSSPASSGHASPVLVLPAIPGAASKGGSPDTGRVQPKQETIAERKAQKIEYAVGSAVDAQDQASGLWYTAEVVRIDRRKATPLYLVHFEGFPPKFNDWVLPTQIAALGTKVIAQPPAQDQDKERKPTNPSQKSGPAVKIYWNQHKKMIDIAEGCPTREIGGDLFGKWEQGEPVIEYVLGPGPKAVGGAASFYQDEKFLEANTALLAQRGLVHIGEWHSHYSLNLPHPSSGDCRTVLAAMHEHDRESYVLCIATIGAKGGAAVTPFLFRRESDKYFQADFGVLDQCSPNSNFIPVDPEDDASSTSTGPGSAPSSTNSSPAQPNHTNTTSHGHGHHHGSNNSSANNSPASTRATSTASVPGQWYSTTDGKRMLGDIFRQLSANGIPKMERDPQTNDVQIRLSKFAVMFPSTFPRSPALLKVPADAESAHQIEFAVTGQFSSLAFVTGVLETLKKVSSLSSSP